MLQEQRLSPAALPSQVEQIAGVPVMEPELELHEVLEALVRRRLLILLIAILGLAAGLIHGFVTKKEFSATATVEFAQPSTRGLGIDNSTESSGELATADILNTELKTEQAEISDENTAMLVIKKLNLAAQAPFAIPTDVSGRDPLSSERGLPLEQAPYQRERVLKIFQDHLSVDIVKGTRLLSVTYRDPDPDRAATVANGVVNAYMEQSSARRYTAVSQVSSWLTDQLALLRQRLEESQRAVEAYGSANEQELAGLGLLSSGASGKGPDTYPAADSVPVARLLALNNNLTSAQVSRLAKEAIYRVAATGDVDAVLSIANSSLVTGVGTDSSLAPGRGGLDLLQHLREQQAELGVQASTAATKYGAKSSVMQEFSRQREAIDEQMQAELGRVRDRTRTDLDLAAREESGLHAQVTAQQREVSHWTTKADKLLLLQGEAASNRSLYEDLYAKLQESQFATGIRTSRVAFTDAARVPTRPTSPRKRQDVAIGLFAGLLLGLVGALGAEYFDSSLHSAESTEKALSTRVIAAIPKFRSKATHPGAWVITEPDSRAAESYRGFRVKAFANAGQAQAKVVLVVSARPAEGKATTCLNTAASLAAQGNRVLVINGDLRRSRRFSAWEEQDGGGLATFLDQEYGSLGELKPISGTPGVWLLPAGGATSKAPELLGSARFGDLIRSLRDEFDYILVNSPPAMLYTDAQVLASWVDAYVLVVLASKTSKKDARAVLHMFEGVKAPMLGVLFNAAQTKSARYVKFGYQL